MTMGDDLVLLAVNPGRRRMWTSERLPFALRVAELAELALAGRLGMGGARRRIEVVDAGGVPDRRLNGTLRVLSGRAQPPTLAEWLRETPRGLTNEYVSRLADQKTLRVSRSRGRDGRTRTEILWVDRERRRAVEDRIDAVAGGRSEEYGRQGEPAGPGDPGVPDAPAAPGASRTPGTSAEETDRTLAALVHVSGLGSHLYGPLLGRGARRRLAALADADPAPAGSAAAAFTGGAGLGEAVRTARELLADLPGAYSDTTSYLLGAYSNPYAGGQDQDIGGHHQL